MATIKEVAPLGALPMSARFSLLAPGALVVVGFGSIVPILPQISRHFANVPDADAAVRALVTAVGGAMAIGGPLAGLLSERFGERAVLRLALVVFAVVGAAGLVIDNVWLLLADRIVVGLALAAVGVAALAMLANGLLPADRNRWLGYCSTWANAATLVMLPIAARLAAIDWRLVFTLNLLALPMLALIVVFVPGQAPTAHSPSISEKAVPLEVATGRAIPVGLIFLGLACGAVGTALPAYLPYRFAQIGNADPALPAAALMGLTLSGAAMAFAYGWLRRWIGVNLIFAIGFLIVASALLVMTLAATSLATVLGMTVAGGGVGMISPNLFAIAADARPERVARRVGFARASYFGAALVAQLPLEPVASRYGAGGAFLAVSAFSLAMAIAATGRVLSHRSSSMRRVRVD